MSQQLELAAQFKARLDRLRDTCTRLDDLYARREVRAKDCDLLYESTFLAAVSYFEGYLEDLPVILVYTGARGRRGHYPIVTARNRTVLRNLLYGNRKYVDMLPLSAAIELAERYLNKGRPFSEIEESDREIIADAIRIRNAIAHRSTHAMSQFRQKVAGVTALPGHRRFPGPLLRRQYRAFPTRRWSDLYLDTIEKVGLKVARDW